ncbi:MAG: hypothetical protein ACYSTY_10905, partial [Planctomycetota bacterium]
MTQATEQTDRFRRPVAGAFNPSTTGEGTTPGSFARPADIGGPYMFASPDAHGMPDVSPSTAWDFLPPGCRYEEHPDGCRGHNKGGEPIRLA